MKRLHPTSRSFCRVQRPLLPGSRCRQTMTAQLWLSAYNATHGQRSAPSIRIATQAPLLVDFRDNSNEAEIKMTLQFASTARAQVGAQPCFHHCSLHACHEGHTGLV